MELGCRVKIVDGFVKNPTSALRFISRYSTYEKYASFLEIRAP